MAPGMADVGSGASAWCGPTVLSGASLPSGTRGEKGDGGNRAGQSWPDGPD